MNDNLKIVAISGKAQHGKDTCAGLLYDELTKNGKRVLITHYADLLKFICKNFFGWDGQKDEKGRQILQYVGTDVVRNERPNYWVEFIIDMIELFGDNWEYVIIPDTRFPNEINLLREHFDNVVHMRVTREDFDSGLTQEQMMHPSETSLDDVVPDVAIYNKGTIETLRELISAYVNNEVLK